MMRMVEIRDEAGIRAVYERLGVQVLNIFYKEFMNAELFTGIFLSGNSYLYEVWDGQEKSGILFFYAENPYAVKMGGAAYEGHVKRKLLLEVMEHVRQTLKERGARCIVMEVPAGRMYIRRLLPHLGWNMCGCIEKYYGEESLLLFNQTL